VTRLTPDQVRDRALLEKDFRVQVDELAEILGYQWMHVDPLRTSGGLWRTPTHGPLGKGWLDSVYVRPNRLIFAEFKSQIGKASPDQVWMLEYLTRVGLEAYLWRPSDFDAIAGILR
jgi:hypothetical protein